MRRSSFWIVACLLASLAIAAGFYVLRGRDGKAAAADSQVVHPEQRTIRNTVNATGTVRLRVGSEVRVGSQLWAGQVIAEIDDRTIQARLADANAQAELDGAAMERARVEYERAERLAGQGLVPS